MVTPLSFLSDLSTWYMNWMHTNNPQTSRNQKRIRDPGPAHVIPQPVHSLSHTHTHIHSHTPAVSTITYFISPAPLTDVPVSTDILSIKSNLSYFLLKRINLDIYKSFHNSISAKATIILQQQRLPSTYSCLSLPTILKRSNFPPSEFSQGKKSDLKQKRKSGKNRE